MAVSLYTKKFITSVQLTSTMAKSDTTISAVLLLYNTKIKSKEILKEPKVEAELVSEVVANLQSNVM